MICVRVGTGFSTRWRRSRAFAQSQNPFRLFSILHCGNREPESLEIPCRSNGSVTLEIHQPLVADDPISPTILYLPTGVELHHPLTNRSSTDSPIVESLIAGSNATVVVVRYRLGSRYHFPTPIHDTLAGYDWIKSRLENGQPLTARDYVVNSRPRNCSLGVCGQLLGGGLALTMALTENRPGHVRPAAIAINNPVTNWILPNSVSLANDVTTSRSPSHATLPVGEAFEYPDRAITSEDVERLLGKFRSSKRKNDRTVSSWEAYANRTPISQDVLVHLRNTILGQPEHAFDPFVSPVLFFRSAGCAVAPFEPYVTGTGVLKDSEVSFPSEPPWQGAEPDQGPYEMAKQAIQHRKTHRLFPPRNSGLVIPRTLLMLHSETAVLDQGLEMATYLRRSIARDAEKTAAVNATSTSKIANSDRFLQDRNVGKPRRDTLPPNRNVAKGHNAKAAAMEAEKRITVAISRRDSQGLWGMGAETGWRRDVEGVGWWLREALKEEHEVN